jgi:glycine/D-amino acid oxidase-like deaminating enzyme
VAEVGVANGDFSAAILSRNRPGHLHLIDAWRHIEDGEYSRDPCNAHDEIQQRRFVGVQQRFAAELQDGRVTMHRMRSLQAAELFPPASLDWVYVDAMHHREAVGTNHCETHVLYQGWQRSGQATKSGIVCRRGGESS